jgi:hypothetical protein
MRDGGTKLDDLLVQVHVDTRDGTLASVHMMQHISIVLDDLQVCGPKFGWVDEAHNDV